METHDTRENSGKLVVPQEPTYNFVKLKKKKKMAMQLSPLSVHHLNFFCSGCGAERKCLYPPRVHGYQKGCDVDPALSSELEGVRPAKVQTPQIEKTR